MRYLMMKRLEMSKRILLEQDDMSVSEVAFTCGFSTSQYFSTVFKKQEKCTPIEYRQRQLVLV
jgi:AraC family L-rhamnose operon regulatory protein RhaS